MHTPQLDKTFLDYFRKHKGVYSQNDVEEIVNKAITTTLERFEGIIKGLEKKHTDHHLITEFACYECAKNGVLTQQLQALSTLKQELLGEDNFCACGNNKMSNSEFCKECI